MAACSRLERAAANAPRPYRFVVLSDHGQSQGTTFEDRYRCSLGELVQAAMHAGQVSEIGAARMAGEESWGYASAAVADVAPRATWAWFTWPNRPSGCPWR